MESNVEWKTKNERYIKELQRMLDIIENVKDEELKNRILFQFLKCDEIVTELAEKELTK